MSEGSRDRSRSPARRGRSASSDRSGSRGRGRGRSGSPSGNGDAAGGAGAPDNGAPGVDELHLGPDDVGFVLGKGGSTKHKIARVADARLELDDSGKLTIMGSDEARKRAREYVDMVLAQRVGPVTVDFDSGRNDLTCVNVPRDCVGYVTGRGGVVLRGLEQEWGTLMFFAKGTSDVDGEIERLAIFGPPGARCGAELKVMSAVEHKCKGWFVTDNGDGSDLKEPLSHYENPDTTFGTETMALRPDEFSYALGKMGSTRKKLARAAMCILEYVGNVAVIGGTKEERARGRDYLRWLIEQRTGRSECRPEGRDDVTVVEIPRSVVGYITGFKGNSLREVEQMSGTFCFTDSDVHARHGDSDTERLLIFSGSPRARDQAERVIKDRVRAKLESDRYGGPGRGGGGGRGGYGGGFGHSSYGGRDRYRDDRGRDRDYGRDRDRDRDRRRSRSRSRSRDRRRDYGRRDRDRGRDRDREYERRRDRSRSRSRDRSRSRSRDRRRSRSRSRDRGHRY